MVGKRSEQDRGEIIEIDREGLLIRSNRRLYLSIPYAPVEWNYYRKKPLYLMVFYFNSSVSFIELEFESTFFSCWSATCFPYTITVILSLSTIQYDYYFRKKYATRQ